MRYLTAQCPLASHVTLFNTQWAFPLLIELTQSPATFSQLKQALCPITNKTLSHSIHKAIHASCVHKQEKTYTISPEGIKTITTLKQLIVPSPTCVQCLGRNFCAHPGNRES